MGFDCFEFAILSNLIEIDLFQNLDTIESNQFLFLIISNTI